MTVRTNNPTRVPGFPKIPATAGPELARYLEALQEAIDIRLGRRGDQRDRAVTLRELIESGLAYDLKANPFDPNNIGSSNIGFAPLNEVPNLDTPPQPTGFSVAGAFSQVNMTWDFPLYQNHAHTEIWRHSTDSIGDAQLIGIQVGRGFVDPIGSGQTRYYWIRHVSQLDVKGPFNATAGTVGQTATDVDHLLEALSGSIAEDDLAQALQDKIGDLDVLSGDVNTSGSLAYEIAAEASARATAVSNEASARATAISNEASARATAITNAVSSLQGQIDDLNAVDDWDSSTSYAVDDLVKYSDKLWKAAAANSNSTPSASNSDWTLVGDYTSLGDAVADNTADITAINFVDASSTSAAATAIASLNSTVNNSTTGVAATANSLSTLSQQVNHTDTGLSATAQNLTVLENALFDDLLDLDEWVDTATYEVGDRVRYNKKAYRAIDDSDSSDPKTPGTDTDYWSLDTIGYASAISSLSTTLNNDYSTTSQTGVLLAGKENSGTAASLISDSEATAAQTYSTITSLTNLETATFTNLTGLSVYDADTTYAIGDRVTHGTGANKAIYTAVAASSSSDPHAPGDTSYWSQDALASNTAMLAALAGKETSGAAAEALSSANTYTDQNAASASDFTALETSLYEEVVGVNAWSSSTSYVAGDRVYHDQKIWRASQNSTDNEPQGGSSYWVQDSVASASVLSALSTDVNSNYATTEYVTTQISDFVTEDEQTSYVAEQIDASETTAAETYATATSVTGLETVVFDDLANVEYDWNSSATYSAGARVKHNRKIYRAVAQSQNVEPGTDTSKWVIDRLALASVVSELRADLESDYATTSAVSLLSTDFYDGVFSAGKWNSSTTYSLGDAVVHEGVVYVALSNHSDQEPPNTSHWLVSRIINQAILNSEISTATSGLATSSDLTQVRVDAYNNITGVPTWDDETSYTAGNRVVHTDSNNATKIYKALKNSTDAEPSLNLSGNDPSWAVDPTASSLALTELSATLADDYNTAEEVSTLLAGKEDSGTAAGLIDTSEATAAETYATIATTNARYAAIFNDMTGVDDWNSGITYAVDARVIRDNSAGIKQLFRATQGSTNRDPNDSPSYWTLDTLAFAAALDTLDLQVNTDGTGIADRVSGIQLRLNDVDGDDTNITMEQRFTAQSNDIGDLETKYTVKIDADGHVAGFGLASDTNAAGGNTSRFFINADRFAIVPEQVTAASAAWTTGTSYSFGNQVVHGGNLYVCQEAHTSTQGKTPGTSGGDDYWVRGDLTPFVVQRTATTDPDGNNIAPGVYMNTAAIKTASITAAMIGSVNADRITTGTLDVAELIDANAIDASKLTIDGSSITSEVIDGVATLQLGSVNVNKLTGNSISATIMSGTTVYANKLTGDVNKLVPFRQTTSVGVAGNTSSSNFSGERTIIENQLPATTHLAEGHRPFASMTGYIDGNASKTYRLRMYMKDNTSGTNSLGQPSSILQQYSTYIVRFTGDQTAKTSVGATLTSTGKSHTVTSVSYSVSSNMTSVGYSLGTGEAFTFQNSITSSASGNYELVGEQRFKATTDNESPYAISGSLGAATRGTVDVKLTVTRYGGSGISDNDNSSGVDYVKEVSGVLMGIH